MENIKDEFYRYVYIQYVGCYNMITEAYRVMEDENISEEGYWYIMKNYSELKNKYKDEYEKAIKEAREYLEEE